ncbi:MAG: gamma-glutamyl kinase [Paracoccaceae bacterium]
MLISVRRRIAYLAMPKTGTTAVEAALAPHCDIVFGKAPSVKHVTYARYRRVVRPMLRDFGAAHSETVCVLREPVDWLHSWWRYRRRESLRGRPQSTEGVSFDAFVEAWLEAEDPPEFARVGRPSRFVSAPKGAPPLDHLFRYDRLDRLAAFLSERFRSEFDFPRLNVSPDDGRPELSAPVRARLEQERPEEFELFHGIG